MSVIITNITDISGPENGPDHYLLRINQQVICKFEHVRKINGLAQCLRDAADAVEATRSKETDNYLLLFEHKSTQDAEL